MSHCAKVPDPSPTFALLCAAADAYAGACQLVEKMCTDASTLRQNTLIILAQLDQVLINMALWCCEHLTCNRTCHMQACNIASLPCLVLLHLSPLQEKVTNTQSSDSRPSKTSPQQSSELADMQQGLQESSAALQAAQSHLSSRHEEVLELTQRLEAAQADIASLQVRRVISLHLTPRTPSLPPPLCRPPFPPPPPSLALCACQHEPLLS